MSFITLDFETYYDKDLGFRTQTNEEYLNDPRFEVIGVGIKVDDNPAKWVTENIAEEFSMLDWGNSALLCHNMLFDGAIQGKKRRSVRVAVRVLFLHLVHQRLCIAFNVCHSGFQSLGYGTDL